MLLIVTYRPEFDAPWIGRPHVTTLTLNRLGEREIAQLIDRLLGNKPLPESIRHDIIERTDGVPLFVEEMTKAVLEAAGEGAIGPCCRCRSVTLSGRSGQPSRFTNGAARPARFGEASGAGRRSDWARVFTFSSGSGSW